VTYCPSLDTTFADINTTDTEIGVTVNVSCVPGYRISGQTTATVHCTNTGQWSPNATCLRTSHSLQYYNALIDFRPSMIWLQSYCPCISVRCWFLCIIYMKLYDDTPKVLNTVGRKPSFLYIADYANAIGWYYITWSQAKLWDSRLYRPYDKHFDGWLRPCVIDVSQF